MFVTDKLVVLLCKGGKFGIWLMSLSRPSLSRSLKNLSLLMTVELLFKEVDDLIGEFEVEVFELDGESLVPVLRFKFVFWYWAEMRSSGEGKEVLFRLNLGFTSFIL